MDVTVIVQFPAYKLTVHQEQEKEKETAMSMLTKEKQGPETSPTTNGEPTRTWLLARQPLSVCAKIVFWASVVRTIAGIGGFIALTLEDSTSQDVGIAALCSLTIVVILATKVRWGPIVTTLIGAYLLYDTFTQPYVLASLADPYGSSGGFIKFIWVIVAMAISLLVFGGSIGAVVQNYHQGSQQAPRWLPSALCLVAGLMIGAIFLGSFSHPAAPTETTYTNSVPTVHIGDINFDQSSVTVAKGSKLLLVDDTSVMHDLFNGVWQNGVPKVQREAGAPVVNGMQVSGNSVTIGPFATAGTYHIFCTVHPGMMLTIIVQ